VHRGRCCRGLAALSWLWVWWRWMASVSTVEYPRDGAVYMQEFQPMRESDDVRPVARRKGLQHDGTAEVWQRKKNWAPRHLLVTDGALVLAFCAVAVVKDSKFAYLLAGLWTLRLAFDALRAKARSAGAPEWSASEAYITHWRHWLRSRRADA
jgi:hypothetical protein